jgi:hypothetical protein
VVKRTQGGSDFDRDWLIALYRECHAQMDAAFYQGRLILTPLGDSRYHCEVVHGGSKWSVRQGGREAVASPPSTPPEMMNDETPVATCPKAIVRSASSSLDGRLATGGM